MQMLAIVYNLVSLQNKSCQQYARQYKIHILATHCRTPMKPSQSESFWKGQMQNDIELRTIPRDSRTHNSPFNPRTYIKHKKAFEIGTRPTSQLQQQPMKKVPFHWGMLQERQLFALQQQLGNRWSAIASRLGADGNSVKNKFYSTLRRGLRRLNKYIQIVRRSRSATHLTANKYLKPEMLVKVNAVVDKTHEEKYEVKKMAIDVAQDIQKKLIELAAIELAYQENLEGKYQFEEKLLGLIGDFNRNCKRRKGKRKVKQQSSQSESESEQEDEDRHPQQLNKATNVSQITFGNNNVDELSQGIAQTFSKFKNEELNQGQDMRIDQVKSSLFIYQQKEGDGSVLEGKESTIYSSFDVRFADSQQYQKIQHSNRLLIAPTPHYYSTDNFSNIVKRMCMSTSYNFNPMKDSTDMEKTLLERIPSLGKKYNPEHALIMSSDIRTQIENLQAKGLIQADCEDKSEKQQV